MVQATYSYRTPSYFSEGRELGLQLGTSGGPAANPFFFSGFLERPRLGRGLLATVGKIAGSRFHVPAAMRDALLRAADPVVTSDGRQLRFESFSLCGGVYARADLLPGSISDGFVASGTTNVDFNASMLAALNRVHDSDATHLAVGADEVTVATLREQATERKVSLPERWLRGLAEVQVAQTRMAPRVALGTVEAKRFLSELARQKANGAGWAVPSGPTLALRREPAPGSVPIPALERLRAMTRFSSSVTALRVWSNDGETPATAWEIDLADSRLTLVISPAANRGFSGEGSTLDDLADDRVVDLARRIEFCATPNGVFDTIDLAADLGSDPELVRRGLTALALAGVAGYDLSRGCYYRRELPFDAADLADLHPRLRSAASIDDDDVFTLATGPGRVRGAVKGRHGVYEILIDGDSWSCTCAWYQDHGASRGPCKHVIAVRRRANARGLL